MFEICSVDGNARTEWLDRLRRAERSRRLDCRGRTRQERRFAVGFASRNSERRLCAGRGAAAFSGRSEPGAWRRTRGQADGKTGCRTAVREFGRGRPPQGDVCVRSGFLLQSRPCRPPQSIRSQPSRQRSSVLPVAEVHLRMRESRFLDRPSSFWTKRQRKTPAATLLAFQLEISTASATKYALDEKRFLHPQLVESCGIEGMVTPIRARLALPENDQLSKSAILKRNPARDILGALLRSNF